MQRWLAVLLLSVSAWAHAEGHVSLTYQYIHIDGFESTIGELDIGTTDTHAWHLEADYKVAERWTVSAGLPFIRKRYRGGGPHRPDLIDPPQDSNFVDDGSYHSDFQDLHLGLKYLALVDPIVVEPFVGYSFPASDYPFFGHAAVGQNIWHFEIGAHFTYVPKLADYFVQVSPSYVFAEETLGQSIDHWRLNVALGYRLTRGVSARVFMLLKDGDGLDFPDDFPPPRDTRRWFLHDRLVKHNYINVGVGVDWQYSETRSVSVSAMRMAHADQVHVMDRAFSISFNQAF